MFRTLHTRLWLVNILLVGSVLCIVAFGVTVYVVRNPAALRQATIHLDLVTNVLLHASQWTDINDQTQFQQFLETADKNLNARFILVSPEGKIIADSRLDEAFIPAIAVNRVIRENTLRNYLQFRDQNKKIWIYTSHILPNGMTLISSNPKPGLTLAEFIRDDFFRLFIRIGLIALILSILLAWVTSQWISRPLESITRTIQQAASGQYNQIPLEGPEEVQSLAKSFNEMTSRVLASEKSQRNFIANVSHDLKTPLTSIQGFAQAILDGTANTPDTIQRAGEVILTEVNRMYHMVLDLLELARLDSGIVKMANEKLNLAPLLQDLAAQFTLQAKQNGKFLSTEIEVLPDFNGDPDRLVQAVSNLLDNALKYSPSGGKVTLKAFPAEDQVEIHVSDEGPGISKEDIQKIFDRFYQADKSRSNPTRGSGLGLSISQEIIQAHGGSISVKNNELPGQVVSGCTFIIKLPVLERNHSIGHKSK
jgi:signal transduction histidine kinase